MTTVNLGGSNGGAVADRPIIPTGLYRMRCVEATVKDNTFGKPNKDGTLPQKISTVWEITQLTDEQREAEEEAEEEWVGLRLWKDFAIFYGNTKEGAPSQLKEFIDSLRQQGHLADFDPELLNLDLNALVDIEQKANVLKYKKQQGPNVGQWGNKIGNFEPLKPAKKNGAKPAPRTEGEELF